MSESEEESTGYASTTSSTATANVAGVRAVPVENALFEYVMRLGDDRLILGHRLSEWCGHGPILEEDIALANMSLDLVGHSAALLRLAGELEAKGRDEDALAYFRDAVEYRNALIVELPKGDFAFTIMRQFLFDAYSVLLWDALSNCKHDQLAAIAAKCLKEDKYHLRHSSEWVVRLGDGTEESQARTQNALNDLWRYTGELLGRDAIDDRVAEFGITIDHEAISSRWNTIVHDVFSRATLVIPTDGAHNQGGRIGRHTEHLGHLLSEMQIVARSHPGASW